MIRGVIKTKYHFEHLSDALAIFNFSHNHKIRHTGLTMTRKFRKKLKSSDITPPKPSGGGVNQGFVSDIWRELAQAKCRADMFRALIRLDIGVNEVEDYNTSLNLKMRSNIFKSKGCQGNREVVRVAMKYKLPLKLLHRCSEHERRGHSFGR